MTNPNDAIRAALVDLTKRLDPELESQLDDEVEALLCGFDSFSVPFAPESGPLARPDFLSAAVEALTEADELPEVIICYYADLNREDRADFRKVSEVIEPILETVARRLILTAWLGGEDDDE